MRAITFDDIIGAPGTVSDRSKDWAAGDQRDAVAMR